MRFNVVRLAAPTRVLPIQCYHQDITTPLEYDTRRVSSAERTRDVWLALCFIEDSVRVWENFIRQWVSRKNKTPTVQVLNMLRMPPITDVKCCAKVVDRSITAKPPVQWNWNPNWRRGVRVVEVSVEICRISLGPFNTRTPK